MRSPRISGRRCVDGMLCKVHPELYITPVSQPTRKLTDHKPQLNIGMMPEAVTGSGWSDVKLFVRWVGWSQVKLWTGLGAADRGGHLVKDRDLTATRSRYHVAGTAGYWETCGLNVEQWNFCQSRGTELRNPRQPEDKKVMRKQTYFTN